MGKEPIIIRDYDFSMESNAPRHHTDQFVGVRRGTDVVLRRGQVFYMTFYVSGRDFEVDTDLVRISFTFGPDGKTTKNTKGKMTVEKGGKSGGEKGWGCRVTEQEFGAFHVKVMTPGDIPVGLWLCEVEVAVKELIGHGKYSSVGVSKPVHFLFNPWSREDSTYMADTNLLEEYVLNDVGKIWVGSYGTARGRQWIFGQFNQYVLRACLLILEKSNLPAAARGDPVKVSRVISKMVNANDDGGVVIGKWKEPYEPGAPPSSWTGSVPILKQYLLTGRSVPYGQCWVFAGVLNTVCRALGLPARVVSNLNSAHDSNASLTIDHFYDENLKRLYPENMSDDSIWTFHVWNDVWMARPLLPPGYGGWQAVDSTPQETSDGVFQCGPTSVRAVKAGEISHAYDGAFLYSSVNADIIRWKENNSTDFGYIQIQAIKDHIGKMILTKKPFIFDPTGDRDIEDVTGEYKHAEGTSEERLVVFNAVGQNDAAKRFYAVPMKEEHDVKFKLMHIQRITVGEDYQISLEIKNKSKEPRSVKSLLTSTSVFYTGVAAQDVKAVSSQLTLQPGAREEVTVTVHAEDYVPRLVEFGIMKISAISTVCETNQTWADEDDFQVLKPSIKIKALDSLKVGKQCRLNFSFRNPLDVQLTDGFYSFESAGLSNVKMLKTGNVDPKAKCTVDHVLVPKRAGKYHLVVTFYSKQLSEITGSDEVKVS